MKATLLSVIILLLFSEFTFAQINSPADDPLRIMVIFAHPDDGEIKMGGTAAMMAKMGHQVKYLSLTNGNAGHHEMGGGALARIRRAEAEEARKRLGIAEYEIFDNHDAELLPDLHVRLDVIRAIREWNADVVFGHRPNDYHPDHRNAGQLVIDSSYMVIVPNVAPDTEPVRNNPVFFYMEDRFTKPNPFSHDVVIGIDEAMDTKLYAMAAHESQFFEWLPWTSHRLDEVPDDPDARLDWMRQAWFGREISQAKKAGLAKWYGDDMAAQFRYSESFEIAEYGRYPTEEEIRMIFPMLPKP
ncbi:MAG: PIG-L family deacetylase [Balneolaceae bacterium]|nr:MAG: PIG-L family deacetylase [Balneolaceae bacterium]